MIKKIKDDGLLPHVSDLADKINEIIDYLNKDRK